MLSEVTPDGLLPLPLPRLPDVLRIRRRAAAPAGPRAAPVTLHAPGAKYLTLRYLLNALLAEGESVVRQPALSEDTAVLVRALRALGASARWEADGAGWALRVRGTGGQPRTPPGGMLAVGNAGAVLRLLLGIGALLPQVRLTTDHPRSLGRRPNADLLRALVALGIAVEASGPEGLLPITLRGGPPTGGAVSVSGARSSQYLSALLYLAPLLPRGLEITVTDELRSAPLVRATLGALAAAGIAVASDDGLRRLRVPGGQAFRPRVYDVPGDAPSAAALLAAALAGGRALCLARLDPAAEEVRALVAAFAALGVPLAWEPDDGGAPLLALAAGARVSGGRLDGDAVMDSVPVLVAAAALGSGETVIENAATLRLKESDRIRDLAAALRAAGCDVTEREDGLRVRGQPAGIAGGARVGGHDDHRLVQALAVVALGSHEGLLVEGAPAVAKSYPDFFAALRRLGARVERVTGAARARA